MPSDYMTEADLSRLAHAILEAPDAVIYSDREGVIRFWNRGAERLFGFSASEALGQSLDIIIPERLRERHWTGYDQTMETGRSRYGEGDLLSVPALHKEGKRISVEFTIAMVKGDDGRVEGVAAIMRDNTARFEEMKKLRKMAAQAERQTT